MTPQKNDIKQQQQQLAVNLSAPTTQSLRRDLHITESNKLQIRLSPESGIVSLDGTDIRYLY